MLLLSAPNLEATRQIAARVADLARVGDVIVLAGEMGSGKTAFAQAFGAALGVDEPITSPTFTLVHSYQIDARRTLHHADLYRLSNTAEVEELALPEMASIDGIVLVEWGDVASALFGPVLEVRLDVPTARGDADNSFGLDAERIVTVCSVAGAWSQRWDRLERALAAFAGSNAHRDHRDGAQ